MYKIIFSFLLTSICFLSTAQSNKWDVSNPPGDWNYTELKFTTDEGTWMNLDVSPDGNEIVFDMLGDIYIMEINGGKAKALRTGIPFEIQPRFSPDGTKISFTSDAGGGDNIWIMDKNGENAHQVTKEKFRLLNNAVWSADGDYIIARKHFTSGRSLGAGEMWMYHVNGGTGLKVTKRKNDQQDVNEPCLSPDGRYLYYSEDIYPGGRFQYNKDPNKQIYAIFRYEFKTGKTKKITGGPGGAARPQISRDGSKLAFVKRVRTKSVLYIHNLKTGEEWPVYDKLNKDQMEAWCLFGVYTNFAWTLNDQELIFWSGGKINKLNLKSLKLSVIPFQVDVNIKIAETLKFKQEVAPETLTAKAIRQAVTSRDGKTLVFSALGKLWKKRLPNGTPTRLTNSNDLEFEPSFSPNGDKIVYSGWNDEEMGGIYMITLEGGKPKKLTKEKGIYRNPSLSSSHLLYSKDGGNGDQGYSFSVSKGIFLMDLNNNTVKKIRGSGQFPQFGHKMQRIFFQTGGSYFGNLTKKLMSVDINGNNEREHAYSKYANRIVPSLNEEWILFSNLHKVYIAPFPKLGKPINLDVKGKNIPISQLALDAGTNLSWQWDKRSLHWTLGDKYYSMDILEYYNFLMAHPDSTHVIDTSSISINLKYKTDVPEGTVIFKGARIITMEGDEVIEEGIIVVKNNRIEFVGELSSYNKPLSGKVYDVTGKTIMPGMVDVHAHVGAFRNGIPAQKHWQFYSNLAFGVTTAHDPSAHTEAVFTLSEMIRSGNMVGPRLFSTGFILYGADGDFKAVINNIDDARSSIRRTKAFGAFSVKSYNQPRRDQRQQVIQAAREENILVVPEGGSTFFHNMTMILDGHTGIEHNIPVAPIYKDILMLWSASKTGYTPTLIVNYGGLNGENYWYQKHDVWKDSKLLKYYPRGIIDSRSRHRTMSPDEEFENGHILVSKTCKQLADSGVRVNLGAHGQLQGLGAHWELWMLQQGGMTNMEALRAATINGAAYISMDHEIGSLKAGKLADLIILDKNPLDSIQNSNSVIYTMVNGRLYETSTMNEVGNYTNERTMFFWENNKYNRTFQWHENSNSFMHNECGCHLSH
jgi:imidazolonepropionase-like amidohydrolase/Tol biopolymer transport system component